LMHSITPLGGGGGGGMPHWMQAGTLIPFVQNRSQVLELLVTLFHSDSAEPEHHTFARNKLDGIAICFRRLGLPRGGHDMRTR
jgi:hypothetical protein